MLQPSQSMHIVRKILCLGILVTLSIVTVGCTPHGTKQEGHSATYCGPNSNCTRGNVSNRVLPPNSGKKDATPPSNEANNGPPKPLFPASGLQPGDHFRWHGAEYVLTNDAVNVYTKGDLGYVVDHGVRYKVRRDIGPSGSEASISLWPRGSEAGLAAHKVSSPSHSKSTSSPPAQPAPPTVCGSWSSSSESVGHALAQKYGEVRNCAKEGSDWIITTLGTKSSSGVIAVDACQSNAACLNGQNPHPLLDWKIYPPPVSGPVTLLAGEGSIKNAPNKLMLDVKGGEYTFDLKTMTWAKNE